MVNVPAAYDPYVTEASTGTGIPYNVVAEQANLESGFNATAVSSAGAEGWLQFLPSTYDPIAVQIGVAPGSEFDVPSETKVYIAYMNQLLQQEGGNLRKALAAYNAGPGNLSAGYGYADTILKAAKSGNTTTDISGGTSAGLGIPGLGGISVSGVVSELLKMLGIASGSLKDMFERLGLIILGFALVLLGIHLLAGGGGTTVNVQQPSSRGGSRGGSEEGSKSTSSKASRSEVETATKKSTLKTGASEAVEAAAVA